jgi:hypothetical protein
MEKALASDWKYIKKAVDDLEDFILAPQDSWPIAGTDLKGGPRDTGRLTIGYLLLSRRRLTALAQDDPRHDELRAANQRIDQVHDRWRANWARKAEKEYNKRLNLWNNCVNELLDDPKRHAAGYADGVRWRAMLDLLKGEVSHLDPSLTVFIQSLDRRLQNAGRAGPFVWEAEVMPAFPKEQFWYLYHALM